MSSAQDSGKGNRSQSNPSENVPNLEASSFSSSSYFSRAKALAIAPEFGVGAREISSLSPTYCPQERYEWIDLTYKTPDECVCHSGKDEDSDFIYMYETLFKDLRVTLPFDSFAARVLRILKVAPTQLHPNGWASMQAFCMVCRALSITPTTHLFLSYYTTRQEFDFYCLMERSLKKRGATVGVKSASQDVTITKALPPTAPKVVAAIKKTSAIGVDDKWVDSLKDTMCLIVTKCGIQRIMQKQLNVVKCRLTVGRLKCDLDDLGRRPSRTADMISA
ncbi:hypothetical protein CR513_07222, partial [Mucuna pruriens]